MISDGTPAPTAHPVKAKALAPAKQAYRRLDVDVMVLGAGMVGVGTALALQRRGQAVALIDRHAEAGTQTSYGNAGIIQREGVVPYTFPRDLKTVARAALNREPGARLTYGALGALAPWLYRYWRQSGPQAAARTARAALPLIERCLEAHQRAAEAAGVAAMLRQTGYLRLYRSEKALDAAFAGEQDAMRTYGVKADRLDRDGLIALEPHLGEGITGAIYHPDPETVADPGALVRAYHEAFISAGGQALTGNALRLAETAGGWALTTAQGEVRAGAAVIALGPWSMDLLRPMGYRLPLGFKRGYHRHYTARGNAVLNRPVIDSAHGYVMAPMAQGIRLTTGAHFTTRDAPADETQLVQAERAARDVFALETPVEAEAWVGARPCLPDMLPIIGPAPRHRGLWLNFGHHHLGFTLGPVTGELLAQMMLDETPFTDPAPYRPERF
ncbi:MAG: FAD-dependent oxidoreductase [Pseudomonadota bacterium]